MLAPDSLKSGEACAEDVLEPDVELDAEAEEADAIICCCCNVYICAYAGSAIGLGRTTGTNGFMLKLGLVFRPEGAPVPALAVRGGPESDRFRFASILGG